MFQNILTSLGQLLHQWSHESLLILEWCSGLPDDWGSLCSYVVVGDDDEIDDDGDDD